MPSRIRSWPFASRLQTSPAPGEASRFDGRILARFEGAPHLRAGETGDGSVAFIATTDRGTAGTVVTFEAQEFVGRSVQSSEPLLLGRLTVAPASGLTHDGVATLNLSLLIRPGANAP